jgi:hypothetical protein
VFALNSAGRPATLAWLGTALIALIMVASTTVLRQEACRCVNLVAVFACCPTVVLTDRFSAASTLIEARTWGRSHHMSE